MWKDPLLLHSAAANEYHKDGTREEMIDDLAGGLLELQICRVGVALERLWRQWRCN